MTFLLFEFVIEPRTLERFFGLRIRRLTGPIERCELLAASVADSLDAMTNDRPYRRGRPVADAILELQAWAGRQFSPRVVDALVRLFDRGSLPGIDDALPLAHEGLESLAA